MAGVIKRLEFIGSLILTDSKALTSGDYGLTYASLLEELRHRIRWLREADAKVVALYSENSIEWVLIDLACQELELVFIPLPLYFSKNQLLNCIKHSGVDTLLSDQQELPNAIDSLFDSVPYYSMPKSSGGMHAWKGINPHRSELPKKTQKITFTSGSTARPKGVCLSSGQQWRVAESLADAIGIRRPKHLCLLPFSTLLENIAGVYTPLLCGGEVVIPSAEERGQLGSSEVDTKSLLACINSTNPTSMILVPQLLTCLLQECGIGWQPPDDLRYVAVGGGKVSPRLIELARFFGLPVYQGYGLSECASVVALNTPLNDRIGYVGKILPHCSVKIERNEIVVSGAIHLGYLEEPSTWYPTEVRTGDTGSLYGGFLSIDGRKKNILVSSYGRNISPEWVESVMMAKPLLRRCFVLGDARPFLVALISAPAQVSDSEIDCWIDACNKTIPDYARIGKWIRVLERELQPYLTANGRPRRAQIALAFSKRLDGLYLSNS